MNPIQIAAKFYEARDMAWFLWPMDWREKIAPFVECINEFSGKQGWVTVNSTLKTAMHLAEGKDKNHLIILWLAAAAEIMEPS